MAGITAQTQVVGEQPHPSSYEEFVEEFLGHEFCYLESYLDEINPELKSKILILVDQDNFVMALGIGTHFTDFNVPQESVHYLFPTTPVRHFDNQGDCDYRIYTPINPVDKY